MMSLPLPPGTGDPALDAALVDVAGRLAADPIAFADRLAAAYHEAGHVVVAAALDMQVGTAEVFAESVPYPEGMRMGQATFDGRRVWGAEKALARMAVACLAGPVAEAKLKGVDFADIFVNEVDKEPALALAEQRPGITFDRIREEAERYVGRHWRAIEAVALELNEAGRVDGAAVADIMRAARPRPRA